MLGMTIQATKGGFFDRKKVLDATDKATRKTLSRFGAYVRRRAKSSIRKRQRISQPGSPPSSHVGTLRKLIFFGYDVGARSVVIGPTLFRPGSRVPSLLESGGTVKRTIASGRIETLRYRKRPYMKPAFDAELSRLPQMWRNSVR